ncbi:MAG: hypothetical protein R3E66_22560 [bacterium]
MSVLHKSLWGAVERRARDDQSEVGGSHALGEELAVGVERRCLSSPLLTM